MKVKRKGKFISFEGPEASGKSSQIKLIKKYFIKKKIPFLITREPGGTLLSEQLRKIILDKNKKISTSEEILLLMAARYNHIEKVIKPALNNGKIVISDRFADSTFVYQGFVNNYGVHNAIHLHKKILKNFLPFKTFLFLITPQEINLRLKKRKYDNKYDKINLNFHKKVIAGYKKISYKNKRFVNIKGNQNIEYIHQEIIKNLKI